MNVEPKFESVGSFFNPNIYYEVPRYQRSYAWEQFEIDDFLNDLKRCFLAELYGDPKEHFFGAIVTIEHKIRGSRIITYELIDGQQRMATFVLLGAILIEEFDKVLKILNRESPPPPETSWEISAIESLKNGLKERFVSFETVDATSKKNHPVISLSKVDRDFFHNLVNGQKPHVDPAIKSHQRLENAFQCIGEMVDELKAHGLNNTQADYYDQLIGRLQLFDKVLQGALMIVNMIAYDKPDAFKLFQVINNRGKSISQGDMLRTHTLEILEDFNEHQQRVEQLWNQILIDNADDTYQYLKWIFSAKTGQQPRTNTLFEDYLDLYFPESRLFDPGDGQRASLVLTEADNIRDQVDALREEFMVSRNLKKGHWPFDNTHQLITEREQYRVFALIKELKYEDCIPLLIAATKLPQQHFSEIVQMLERFWFRFWVVCKNYPPLAIPVFYEEAKKISDNPGQYRITSLRTRLNELLNQEADDRKFKQMLAHMEYNDESGVSNKPLKYFLASIEDYSAWYDGGARRHPVCMENSLTKLNELTIEHVYARNIAAENRVTELESRKHNLGNLTLLPRRPDDEGNKPFEDKKTVYRTSSITLNQKIAEKPRWTSRVVTIRKNELIDMACAIFLA